MDKYLYYLNPKNYTGWELWKGALAVKGIIISTLFAMNLGWPIYWFIISSFVSTVQWAVIFRHERAVSLGILNYYSIILGIIGIIRWT